jgi:hypothetical protein
MIAGIRATKYLCMEIGFIFSLPHDLDEIGSFSSKLRVGSEPKKMFLEHSSPPREHNGGINF